MAAVENAKVKMANHKTRLLSQSGRSSRAQDDIGRRISPKNLRAEVKAWHSLARD